MRKFSRTFSGRTSTSVCSGPCSSTQPRMKRIFRIIRGSAEPDSRDSRLFLSVARIVVPRLSDGLGSPSYGLVVAIGRAGSSVVSLPPRPRPRLRGETTLRGGRPVVEWPGIKPAAGRAPYGEAVRSRYGGCRSHFSSKKSASTILPGQRESGFTRRSTIAQSGSLGVCLALLR